MTTEAPIFSPDIEELLREIAKEPDSVLLRVPREKVPAALLETRSPIGPMTAGLSNAERELVRVHREEFAFGLRQACWVKHASNTKDGRFLTVRGAQLRAHDLPDRKRIEHDIAIALTRAPGTESLAIDFACFIEPLDRWPSVPKLCAIANRLAPSELHVLHAGAYWALQDCSGTALSLFTRLLDPTRVPTVMGRVQANIAYCYDRIGQLGRSVVYWRSACIDSHESSDYVPSWLAISLRAGADRDIRSANSVLRDMGAVAHEGALAFAARLKLRRAQGFWSPDDQLFLTTQKWTPELCEEGRVIADGLCGLA